MRIEFSKPNSPLILAVMPTIDEGNLADPQTYDEM